MQGWTFDEVIDLLLSIGRQGARPPFRTGQQLVSSRCLPYRVPDGGDEDPCVFTSSCSSQEAALEGEWAGWVKWLSC
jgi:hypothetical protein